MELTLLIYHNQPLAVALDHIRYLQGSGNYSVFHRSNGRAILVSQTLKRWQEKLPGFVRISQGCLVNPAFIDWSQVPSRQNPTLRLNGGQALLVARRRLPTVATFMDEHRLSSHDDGAPEQPSGPAKSPATC